MNEGDQLSKRYKNPNTYFSAKAAPGLTIKAYLTHLIRVLGTPPANLILMMIYVERLLQSLTSAIAASGSSYPYLLTSLNAHRIVLTALILAHKYSMDVAYPFSLLAKVVGVSVTELKILESEFLNFIKYELFVSQDLYEKYEEVLQQWPELATEEEDNSATTGPQSQKSNWMDEDNVIADMQPRQEESKEIDEYRVIKRKVQDIQITDEEHACSLPDFIIVDRPNPSNPHEKPLAEWIPANSVRYSDARTYDEQEFGSENSDDEDEDTEMTIVDESDLGIDDFEEEVILY